MFNLNMFTYGVVCFVLGMLSGAIILYTYLAQIHRDRELDIKEKTEQECLETVRENYQKEQTTRKLLLYELGEALDVDVIYLPSFGYITLKRAFEIPEDIVEACIGYEGDA